MKHQGFSVMQEYMNKWPYIIVYQHQGMNVPMWQQLRSELGNTMECMVVKNSQAARVLNNNKLCSGSTCFVGVSSMEDIKQLEFITKKYSYSLLLIGGFWDNKCWTHEDIQQILNLGSIEQIWGDLISTMLQSENLVTFLSHNNKLCINTIETNSNTLCNILTNIHNKDFVVYILNKSQSNRRFPYGYLVTTSLQL